MDKDTKMSLIKGLLAGQLTKKQRRSYADLESVDRELKIQWNESENKAIDFKIKEQIWEKVKARCVDRKRNKVLLELCAGLFTAQASKPGLHIQFFQRPVHRFDKRSSRNLSLKSCKHQAVTSRLKFRSTD